MSRDRINDLDKDFSMRNVRILAKRGIKIYDWTYIPAASGEMKYANGERGYVLDNNGQSQVRTYLQVLELCS